MSEKILDENGKEIILPNEELLSEDTEFIKGLKEYNSYIWAIEFTEDI